MHIQWKIILRNAAIILGLTFFGGVVVTFSAALVGGRPSTDAVGLANLMFTTLGFFASGCLTPSQRWQHLILTVLATWLMSLINLRFGVTIVQWIFALPLLFVLMLVGGGLSVLFVRESDSTHR